MILTVDRFGTVEIGRRFEPHDGHLVKYRSQRVCTSLVSCEGSQFWECLSDAIDFMRFDFKVETLEKYRIIIVIGVENIPYAEVCPNSLGAHNEDRLVCLIYGSLDQLHCIRNHLHGSERDVCYGAHNSHPGFIYLRSKYVAMYYS